MVAVFVDTLSLSQTFRVFLKDNHSFEWMDHFLDSFEEWIKYAKHFKQCHIFRALCGQKVFFLLYTWMNKAEFVRRDANDYNETDSFMLRSSEIGYSAALEWKLKQ